MGWLGDLFGQRKASDPPPYVGAIHGHRFVVVRRPTDTVEYGGWSGGRAREVYETTYPARGEIVELWDKDICRGRK
jgi:hypothetical protein